MDMVFILNIPLIIWCTIISTMGYIIDEYHSDSYDTNLNHLKYYYVVYFGLFWFIYEISKNDMNGNKTIFI